MKIIKANNIYHNSNISDIGNLKKNNNNYYDDNKVNNNNNNSNNNNNNNDNNNNNNDNNNEIYWNHLHRRAIVKSIWIQDIELKNFLAIGFDLQ